MTQAQQQIGHTYNLPSTGQATPPPPPPPGKRRCFESFFGIVSVEPFNCLSVILRLDEGDFPEYLQIVCPCHNKYALLILNLLCVKTWVAYGNSDLACVNVNTEAVHTGNSISDRVTWVTTGGLMAHVANSRWDRALWNFVHGCASHVSLYTRTLYQFTPSHARWPA